MNHKILGIIFVLITLMSFANATLLASTSVDKNSLSTNEIGMLTIKLFNDSQDEVKEIIVRATADDQIRFLEEEEKTTFVTSITSIPGGTGKELKIAIKSLSTKKDTANVYVYFGTTQPFNQAAVTTLYTKELPILVKATVEKKTLNNKETILVDFKLTNTSKEAITKVSAEVIPPTGFEGVAAPVFAETLQAGASIEKKFELIAPLDASGDQMVTLAYGLFDASGPHYFEQNFKMNFVKPNYSMLLFIGAIVLIIAVYLYIKREKTIEVKGTSEKKK
ncbi:MAG: NEW3 domain-containing protein [archaeon]|jgi:hypothetical protein